MSHFRVTATDVEMSADTKNNEELKRSSMKY
jgi:hypothetical protein